MQCDTRVWSVLAAAAALLSPGALAQRQFAEESHLKSYLPAGGGLTYDYVAFDVDGDGDVDLVEATSSQNRLYLNDGAGIFTDVSSQRMPSGRDTSTSVAAGDVDGDGDVDLLFGNAVNSVRQNRLYLNDGSGRFEDFTTARMPADAEQTTAVELVDVDGDGDLDALIANSEFGAGRNQLYLNDGAGTFVDVTTTHMPEDFDASTALAVGDVDGDGDADVVVANNTYFGPGGQPNRLYLNDGSGRFTDGSTGRLPAEQNFSRSVALGDLDGDGDLDLVVGNSTRFSGNNRLYLNDGNGVFGEAPPGRLPLVATFRPNVLLVDVDADGDLDMLWGVSGQGLLFLNQGGVFDDATATWLPPISGTTGALAAADVNGDGRVDVVFGKDSVVGDNQLLLQSGAGRFIDTNVPRFNNRRGGNVVAAIDADGDGDQDLVAGGFSTSGAVTYNDGNGVFRVVPGSFPGVATTAMDIAIADVDGDGDPDVVFANFQGTNRLFLNNGGRFTDATVGRLPPDADDSFGVAVGDVDGDGDVDLLFGNGAGDLDRLYLNDGAARFTDVTGARMPFEFETTRAVRLADVDADGDLDCVLASWGQTRLLLNDGEGTFANATAGRMPVDTEFSSGLTIADIDADGDADLLISNSVGSGPVEENQLYVNDGMGNFTDVSAAQLPTTGESTARIEIGDVDLDGDPDLLLVNPRGTVRLLLNDGGGTFTDATDSRLPSRRASAASAALADFDGDGDLDYVLGALDRLFVNRHRQLSAPLFAGPSRGFELVFHAEPGYANASHTAIPALSLSLAPAPLVLSPWGRLYLSPTALIPLPPVLIDQVTGTAQLNVPVPPLPALAGRALFGQALIVDGATERARFTSYTADLFL